MKKPPLPFLVIAISLMVFLLAYKSGDDKKGLLIKEVTIVSPEREAPLEHGYIKIRDGKIEEVGEWRPDVSTTGYVAHDAAGKYIIPGLIDSHVHLAVIPGIIDVALKNISAAKRASLNRMAEEYKKQLPRSYLYYGYTALIDLNVVNRDFIDDVKGAPIHPDIFDCDGGLMLANGYPMLFSPPGERFKSNRNFLYDPEQKDKIPAKFRTEDHSPEADVRRVKENGGICVKTFYESGFGSSKNWPVPTHQMLLGIAAYDSIESVVVHGNLYPRGDFSALQ